jgi:23S rRNA (cytosine1962-C5)-methyltransferase
MITGKSFLFERSDVDIRKLEGLEERTGTISGPDIQDQVTIIENGLQFHIDIKNGHKTGFYLDQRENRYFLRALARDREILDCFCYTGGFTCSAAFGGARSILAVDASANVLQLAAQNLSVNHLDSSRVEFRQGDVFKFLREMRDRGRTFDLVILDPPKFAQSASQVEKAARGYKDINLLAFKLLRPGGLLMTFSCSGGVDEALFQKIVAGAALDANVNARILKRMSQSPDHPVALNFPEGAYLKGLVIQVD